MNDLIAMLQIASYIDRWTLFLLGIAIGLWLGYVLRIK